MAELDYAFIKNGNVVNIALFDDPSEETLNIFKEFHEVDLILLANEKTIIGSTYDGLKFWLPQPFSSWIKNEEINEWEAPIPYPSDGKIYQWDEDTISWIEVQE